MERMRKRADFLHAAKGDYQIRPGLVLQARRQPDQETIRIGFTTSKKVGNAVERNRARRRLRALADEIMPDRARAGYDYVLIGRKNTLTRTFDDLRQDLQQALSQIHKPH